MKAYYSGVLAVSVLFFLAGCSTPMSPEKVILTSFYPVYIATLNVTENVPGIIVRNMTSPHTGCLHDYQLTPADAASIERASVLVVNGGGMESFLEKAASLNKKLLLIDASEGIEFISNGCSGHHDHSHHHLDRHETNAHVWLSVSNAYKQVNTIARILSRWDSTNTHIYQMNAKTYGEKLLALKQKMHEELEALPHHTIVTFHEAFPYFAREFGLQVAAVIEREPGSEPSAAELVTTISIIRNHHVKALFIEPQYPSSAAQTISRETGLPLHTLDPVVSGPLHKDAYLEIMEKNLTTLKEALK